MAGNARENPHRIGVNGLLKGKIFDSGWSGRSHQHINRELHWDWCSKQGHFTYATPARRIVSLRLDANLPSDGVTDSACEVRYPAKFTQFVVQFAVCVTEVDAEL
jgi:hypothetical protein